MIYDKIQPQSLKKKMMSIFCNKLKVALPPSVLQEGVKGVLPAAQTNQPTCCPANAAAQTNQPKSAEKPTHACLLVSQILYFIFFCIVY
jgi:hypothetical protein